jgi:glucosyltransferase
MLDVIVPCYNEENGIKLFYESSKNELKTIKHTFIFIDDGSNDNTLEELKKIYDSDKEHVRIITFTRNYGKESAIYAGLLHSKGDYVSIIDSDLQQNPKYLVKMYNFLKDNKEYDCIAMCQKQNKNRFFQKCFYNIMNSLSEIHLENGASDFRMFRKKVVKSILEFRERNRFTKGIFSYLGYKTYYEEYEVEKRIAGKSKWGFRKLFNYATNGIVAFSIKPLRMVTYTGLATSFSAFIYLIILIVKTLINGKEVAGYASIMCVLLFIGGFLLIGLGIIGEYIGKIYNETKYRPLFIENDKIGFEDDIL